MIQHTKTQKTVEDLRYAGIPQPGVEGAAGFQVFGDLKAEGDGGDAGGSLRSDTGDLFAVGRGGPGRGCAR